MQNSPQLIPIERSFFNKSTIDVAKSLLGKYIVHKTSKGEIVGKIVETEAYLSDDPASHSFNGKNERNKSMFSHPGTSYVYLIYGMYYCFNIVTNKKDVGEAVLIRALEPVFGIELMEKNRKMNKNMKTNNKSKNNNIKKTINLYNGPGKLVMGLGLDKKHGGLDLLNIKSNLRLMEAKNIKEEQLIVSTTRIGITKGTELPHRYYIKDNPFISKS